MAAALVVGGSTSAVAQTTHVIRLEAEPEQELHRFVPARVTAKPGDVLRFRVTSGAPHNIAFEAQGLPAQAHEALNAAMPSRSGDLSGPVLTANGAEYRMTVPAIPPGRYVFFSLPHRAYEMTGELIVTK
jgi:plastocyanin